MFYTWMDIEWKIMSERKNWLSVWYSVEVYPDELIINLRDKTKVTENESLSFLKEMFHDSLDVAKQAIHLRLPDNFLGIVFEEADGDTLPQKLARPLFKNSFYQEVDEQESPALNQLQIPVISFHSYKGGVGRTLSLIALLRELSRQNKDFKALVVDADIEAPGLTLMAENYSFPSENRISYADILSIIHASKTDALFGEVANEIAKLMVNSTITVPGDGIDTESFFIPAYRFDYQLLDNFIHPETIISMPDRSFIIQEFFSELGKILGADAVIIDLRAGFSELSAPFLFDPRINRVLVTTTSKQSVVGTKKILDKIFESSFFQRNPIGNEDAMNMTILLTMIPKEFDLEKLNRLKLELVDTMSVPMARYDAKDDDEEGDTILSDMVIESKFSDNLIHLENLDQIIEAIRNGASVSQAAEILAKRLVFPEKSRKKTFPGISEKDRHEIIDKVHDIAYREITAEGESSVKIMATGALEKVCRAYQDSVPKVVVLGAKGSGKTYIYKQLLTDLFWDVFAEKILSKGNIKKSNIMIMPVLATKNRFKMNALLEKCLSNIKKELGVDTDIEIFSKNEMFLQGANARQDMQAGEWLKTWNKLFLDSLSADKYGAFRELDKTLASIEKKIVFIIDGLEDIFNETIESKNSQEAIKSLCQDVVNQFSEYKNIGIVVFVRNDISKNSIRTNYDQFERQYTDYALKWSQEEALRLVTWILDQAGFFKNKKDLIKDTKDIPKLSRTSLDDCLIPFWGLKLGRDSSNEAFSTRWIIAALSDLNLQIQARDIIRFLSFATSNYTKDIYYQDRILLPADIKKAIPYCSAEKREEICNEMTNFQSIFEKLEKRENLDIEKELPIKIEAMNLMLLNAEKAQLEAQGFLTQVGNGYYFPEIIRHALGYKYAHGARPRVLSLLQTR
jgi:cellulose biosynthesis protein BcsQ